VGAGLALGNVLEVGVPSGEALTKGLRLAEEVEELKMEGRAVAVGWVEAVGSAGEAEGVKAAGPVPEALALGRPAAVLLSEAKEDAV
jgi:hypothetical protein